jgi:hypothetical protein
MNPQTTVFFLVLGLAWAATPRPALAETITINGKVIENAEMAEVTETGMQYKTPEGNVIVPWADLNQFQRTAIQTRFAEALDNLRVRAIWVEGTVFERLSDGVVVQVSLDLKADTAPKEETEPGADAEKAPKVTEWKNGGEVAKGLVIIKDLKDSAVKMPGDPVAGVFFKVGTFTYEVGGFGLIREISQLTQAKPAWGAERDWTNLEGKKIKAKLRAVKEGQCLLESAGKSYPYPIDQLSEEDRALIAEFEKRARQIPL